MKKIVILLLFCLSMVSSFSWADSLGEYNHTGWYVGGQVGQLGLSMKDKGDSNSSSTSVTDNSPVFGIYGGYDFTNWFGLESSVNYASFGNNKYTLAGLQTTTHNSYWIATLEPKLTYQINNRLSVYGKAGINYSSLTYAANTVGDNSLSLNGNGIGMSAGAGVQFALTQRLNVRLAYDYASTNLNHNSAKINGGSSSDSSDSDGSLAANIVSVGLHYRF